MKLPETHYVLGKAPVIVTFTALTVAESVSIVKVILSEVYVIHVTEGV
jgi:hypothetical protein